MAQKIRRTKRVLKVGEIGAKNDTLYIQEKQQNLRGNNTKRSLEMNSWQRRV